LSSKRRNHFSYALVLPDRHALGGGKDIVVNGECCSHIVTLKCTNHHASYVNRVNLSLSRFGSGLTVYQP
jgi:hypothetical protein